MVFVPGVLWFLNGVAEHRFFQSVNSYLDAHAAGFVAQVRPILTFQGPFGLAAIGLGIVVLIFIVRGYFESQLRGIRPDSTAGSSQVNISGSNIAGPVAGRDVNIEKYIQAATAAPDSERGDEYHKYPTPTAIIKAIDQAPLYFRPTIESSYVSIKVRWQSKLDQVVPREKKSEIAVQFRTLLEPRIHVIVLLNDYPILKTVHGGEKCEMTGTIERVQTDIWLADVKLKFLS